MFDIQQANMDAAEVLTQAKRELLAIYDHPDGATQILRISSTLDRLTNSLHVIGGTTSLVPNAARVQFEPVTSFMGEEINFRTSIAADAQPTMDEVQAYQKKVEDLYFSIPAMVNDKVIADYKGNAGMELVLRGVAKKANVQNYAEAAITTAFVEAIKEGIIKNDAEDLLREQEEARLMASLVDKKPENTVQLTEQHLTAFPHLLQQGLKAGDVVDKSILNVEPVKTPPAPATEPVNNVSMDFGNPDSNTSAKITMEGGKVTDVQDITPNAKTTTKAEKNKNA